MQSIYQKNQPSSTLIKRLEEMPKAEIHVHLEGATDAATVWELAQSNHVKLPAATLEEWQAMYAFRDFSHFIEIYKLAAGCMQTVKDFAFMTERFLAQQAKQNVHYCELFLSATYLIEKFSSNEITAALREAVNDGKQKYGVEAVFIPDIARQEPDSRFKVLDFVLQGREQGVFVGLGLGGAEIGYPPKLFTDVYTEARQQGVHVVAHAGETGGPESVWGAINDLQVERIGHGVQSVEDEKLVDYLRQTQIPLEVSPKSNYRLKIVPYDQPHPIHILMQQGVYVTINTDDPPMFSTNLNDEYVLLAQQGLSWEELWQLNLNTLNATFLPEARKATYLLEWAAFKSRVGDEN